VRAIIGARLLGSAAAQPKVKPFEIFDSRLPGFVLRIQPSGVRTFYARLGRGRRLVSGKVGHLTADQARHRCELALGNVAHGREPTTGLDGATKAITLRQFLEIEYMPWAKANRPRSASASIDRLERCFIKWYDYPLTTISTG
jgi:hypothetical protein